MAEGDTHERLGGRGSYAQKKVVAKEEDLNLYVKGEGLSQ